MFYKICILTLTVTFNKNFIEYRTKCCTWYYKKLINTKSYYVVLPGRLCCYFYLYAFSNSCIKYLYVQFWSPVDFLLRSWSQFLTCIDVTLAKLCSQAMFKLSYRANPSIYRFRSTLICCGLLYVGMYAAKILWRVLRAIILRLCGNIHCSNIQFKKGYFHVMNIEVRM
jgi:hypothetical protein